MTGARKLRGRPGNPTPTAEPGTSGTSMQSEAARRRKAAYGWNTAAGLIHSCQSIFMLIVITRVCDVYTAGVFTIAYAVANLFMNVGWYGMRKFQASDRECRYTFDDYRASRIVTTLAMVACSAVYVTAYGSLLGYTADKALVVLVMCLFKTIDCFEDVYSGGYQRQDRLDVGARMVTLRQVATIPFFAAFLVATRSLLATLVAATVFTALFFVGQVLYVRRRYDLPTLAGRVSRQAVAGLLRECLPLFVGAFLLFYISTAPRYAIDANMDDAAQAYFGYISMPVFVVSMLSSFIYNPMITELTDQWLAGELRPFLARFARVSVLIVGITAVCVLGCLAVGIPVLNLIYNADVSPYLVELLVLVAGGGFMALIAFATVGITIIRMQGALVPLYAVLAVASYLLSDSAVQAAGIAGASWAYLGYMAFGAALFAIVFVMAVRRRSRES